jgi:hypothetical protein
MASKGDEQSFLNRFARCAVGLRNILYEDRDLSDTEIIFMDNHFKVLEMAYFRWRGKHMPHLSEIENGTIKAKST